MAEKDTKFNSVYGDHIAAAYVSNNEIVVAYRGYKEDSGSKGYITLGFVQENNVFFNEPTLFHDCNIFFPVVAYDSLNNKVIVAYRDNLNGYGMVRVGTINNNNIVFNEPVVFSKNNVYYVTAMYDKVSEKVIIGYLEEGNGPAGIIRIGTISGNNITLSDPVVFSNNHIYSISMTYDSDNDKVVLAYCDDNNKSRGIVRVGTLVDDTMVFGNEAVFNDSNSYYTSMVYDYKNKKIIIAYANADDKGMAKVGTISDNNVVFSDPVTFSEYKTKHISTLYGHVNNKVLIAYRDVESDYISYEDIIVNARIITGTVTENSISFNEPVTFSNTGTHGLTLVSDNNKIVVVYHDGYNGHGAAKVI